MRDLLVDWYSRDQHAHILGYRYSFVFIEILSCSSIAPCMNISLVGDAGTAQASAIDSAHVENAVRQVQKATKCATL